MERSASLAFATGTVPVVDLYQNLMSTWDEKASGKYRSNDALYSLSNLIIVSLLIDLVNFPAMYLFCHIHRLELRALRLYHVQ